MTKVRPPLTVDAAMARIAGRLPGGWAEIAAVADRSEQTVRAWGDNHQPESVPLTCAIALDIAYRKAGGDGRPLFDVYQLLLELAEVDTFGDQACHARAAGVVVGEASDAVQALIAASLPSAGARDDEHAVRQLEDLIQAATAALAGVRPP